MLFGVPMNTPAGIYPLTITLTGAESAQTPIVSNVQVAAGGYGSEFINLMAGRAGLLDPNVENAELAQVQSVMTAFSPVRYFDGAFSLPAAATMTSPFGTRRSYNGGAFDRIHYGADFAGVPGTPVLAPAPGVVVFAQPLEVRGVATIVDHGWGVYTGYWHQTEQYVRVGDSVVTGQVIGTIGATGRVTGAHLHWELWVNGVPVDPMQWVRQSFS
jgi:murein DD-endopeptidase MepM/ murein hydrolase activator NlpD